MLRDEANALFDAHSPYRDDSLRNHCLRIDELTRALADREGAALDEDLVFAGAMLHDIGLLVKDPDEPNYLKRGAKFVEPRAESWGLDEGARRDLREMLLYNHALRAVPGSGPTADLMRRAVQVEHSRGRIRHGLDRRLCRDVFRRYPRLRFDRVLLDFFKTTLLDDGPTQLYPIFLPRRAS